VTTLSKELRAALAQRGLTFSSVEPVVVQRSSDNQNDKRTLSLHDGKEVEAVLMEHTGDRTTVSSRRRPDARSRARSARPAGGFTRNLSSTEIFDKRASSRASSPARKEDHQCGLHGMANRSTITSVMGAVALLNDPHGFGLGHRHIRSRRSA